jgi:hypothetical protein
MKFATFVFALVLCGTASAATPAVTCTIESQNERFQTVDSVVVKVDQRSDAHYRISTAGRIAVEDRELEDRRADGSEKFVGLSIEDGQLLVHTGMSGGISSVLTSYDLGDKVAVTDYVNKFKISCPRLP